jgi:hypothetical protein
MKKIILPLTILWWSLTFILVVSCKEATPEAPEVKPVSTDWKVEVKYLDKTVDTLVIRSIDAPFLYITDHVSIVTMGDSYYPAASYVKTINILNQK